MLNLRWVDKMDSFIEKIFENARVEDAYGDNEYAQVAQEAQRYFQCILGMLGDPDMCPNPTINALAQLVWNLIGKQMIPAVMMSELPVSSFMFEKKGDKELAMIMLPTDFSQRCKDDPYMQFGAVVFLASQARDAYNGRIPPEEETARRGIARKVHKRAHAFEAEYLLTAQQNCNDFTPNEYQQELLKRFPNGLDSLEPELKYDSKPFVQGPPSPILDGYDFPKPPKRRF